MSISYEKALTLIVCDECGSYLLRKGIFINQSYQNNIQSIYNRQNENGKSNYRSCLEIILGSIGIFFVDENINKTNGGKSD